MLLFRSLNYFNTSLSSFPSPPTKKKKVRLPRIPPGANGTHVLVVRPRKFGYFNFTAAEVTYRPSDDLEQVHVGFSSDPGQGLIISAKDYEKQFSAHMVRNNNYCDERKVENHFFFFWKIICGLFVLGSRASIVDDI